MWHKGTVRPAVALLIAHAAAATAALGQSATDWRKVGGSAVDLALAAPATGPVDQVWFSAGGSAPVCPHTLPARSSRLPISKPGPWPNRPPEPPGAAGQRPRVCLNAGRGYVVAPGNRARFYGLGRQLFRSDDGGRTWENLTAYRSNPIVGTGQHGLAISPVDPDQLVVANDFGVWRSLDGGLSWNGLNQFLPNLAVRRILCTPTGAAGTRVVADGLGALELPPGGTVWQPLPTVSTDPDAAAAAAFQRDARRTVSAAGLAGRHVYAGTPDGRTFLSVDGGATFTRIAMPAGRHRRRWSESSSIRPIPAWRWRFWAAAVARVLRTITGNFWDVLDGNLPESRGAWHRSRPRRGAVYVATDRGRILRPRRPHERQPPGGHAGRISPTKLPDAPATDVRLDPAGVQLYIALDGYGVYAAAAPHRARNLRIVNAGDFTTRAAAPGSLLTVIGGKVDSATAGA